MPSFGSGCPDDGANNFGGSTSQFPSVLPYRQRDSIPMCRRENLQIHPKQLVTPRTRELRKSCAFGMILVSTSYSRGLHFRNNTFSSARYTRPVLIVSEVNILGYGLT